MLVEFIVQFLSFCIYCHPEWSEGTLLFFLRCFISFSMTGTRGSAEGEVKDLSSLFLDVRSAPA